MNRREEIKDLLKVIAAGVIPLAAFGVARVFFENGWSVIGGTLFAIGCLGGAACWFWGVKFCAGKPKLKLRLALLCLPLVGVVVANPTRSAPLPVSTGICVTISLMLAVVSVVLIVISFREGSDWMM